MGKPTRSEQWGSHGFHCGFISMEGGLYLGCQEGPRQGTVLPRCGLTPCAAWSDDCDRTATARWSRDSCSEEASKGDRTKAGAQERSNSEQSDQITQGKHFQESHSQTPFLMGREKHDPSLILCSNKALSDLLAVCADSQTDTAAETA